MACHFYRAMHFSAKRGIEIAYCLSVCLSVCPSVYLYVYVFVYISHFLSIVSLFCMRLSYIIKTYLILILTLNDKSTFTDICKELQISVIQLRISAFILRYLYYNLQL